MPNVVVYVPAEDARRMESQGTDVKEWVKALVRFALERERKAAPPVELPGQTRIEVDPDPKERSRR